MTVPYGHVVFDTAGSDPALVRLDSSRPQLSGRMGGFTEVARAKRVATTEWQGHGLYRMEVAIILDGWSDSTDQREVWNRLRAMGNNRAGKVHPPVVKVNGDIPGTTIDWVMEDVTPGDAMTGKNGELWRQYAVVKLLEWNPARIVVRKSAVNGAPAHFTLHTAKRGDTLAKLALLYYGSASKWKAIGSAQTPRIRDPRRKLTAGKVLRIP